MSAAGRANAGRAAQIGPSGSPAWLPERVKLVEVGLRDGLQNLPRTVPTPAKLELLTGLLDAGLKRLQVVSFVHPEKVPQMADAEELVASLPERKGVIYSGLALNRRGVERAATAGLKHVDVSMSASAEHSRRNAGMSLEQAEEQLLGNIALARELGMRVRGGVQCAFGCGMDEVPVDRVLRLAGRIVDAGVEELAIADSAGRADPLKVERLLHAVMAAVGDQPLVLHLHDTRGLGIANLMSGLRAGVRRFDTSFGGLGGCPFIPGATGNVATEDVAHLLAAMGVDTGVDLHALLQVTARAKELLGEPMNSRMFDLWQRGGLVDGTADPDRVGPHETAGTAPAQGRA